MKNIRECKISKIKNIFLNCHGKTIQLDIEFNDINSEMKTKYNYYYVVNEYLKKIELKEQLENLLKKNILILNYENEVIEIKNKKDLLKLNKFL